MAKKASSERAAKIAGKVMRGEAYTDKEVKTLAASVLAQHEPDKPAPSLDKPKTATRKKPEGRFHYSGK